PSCPVSTPRSRGPACRSWRWVASRAEPRRTGRPLLLPDRVGGSMQDLSRPEPFAHEHVVVRVGAGSPRPPICPALRQACAKVTAIDKMITGKADNVDHLLAHGQFRLVDYDVTDYLHVKGDVHSVLNFASPASPVDYLRWPIHTLQVGAFGTHKGLGLARDK